MQYGIDEYRVTKYREYISGISDQVIKEYFELFGEQLT
jgi:hypothetical protein